MPNLARRARALSILATMLAATAGTAWADEAPAISGAGSLVQNGNGVLEIPAGTVDTYTGPTVVNSGRGIHAYWPLMQSMARDEWLPLADHTKLRILDQHPQPVRRAGKNQFLGSKLGHRHLGALANWRRIGG